MAKGRSPRARVGGSGYTVFHWSDPNGTTSGFGGNASSVNLIGYAENVTVNPIQPVAQPEVIQPLNAQRPLEIITPGAATNGTITLTLVELYNFSVWQRLATLANSQDIVDIFRTMASLDQGIHITKTIRPPFSPDQMKGTGGTKGSNYWET